MIALSFVLIDGSWFAVYSLGCALWHELFHIIALKGDFLLSQKTHGIAIKTGMLSYKKEILVTLAGPFASFLAFLVFYIIYAFLKSETVFFLYASNLVLFLINLLPIYPLDGARALLALLSLKLERQTAVRISRIISFIFLLPLCFLSVIILLKTGYNLSLLIICVFLLTLSIGVKDL